MAKQKKGPKRYETMKDMAVAAVITCDTEAQAAALLGVSPRTLRSWRAREDFQEALAAKQSDMAAQVDESLKLYLGKLSQYGPEALDEAYAIMKSGAKWKEDPTDPDAPPMLVGDNQVRLAASRFLGTEWANMQTFFQNERRHADLRQMMRKLRKGDDAK